jgi:hypothetical protein
LRCFTPVFPFVHREADAEPQYLLAGGYGLNGAYGHNGVYGAHAYGGYSGPLAAAFPADVYPASAHGLVQHYNGAVTPLDTPSVQAARASHLATKSHILAHRAPLAYAYGSHGLSHGLGLHY